MSNPSFDTEACEIADLIIKSSAMRNEIKVLVRGALSKAYKAGQESLPDIDQQKAAEMLGPMLQRAKQRDEDFTRPYRERIAELEREVAALKSAASLFDNLPQPAVISET